MRSLKDLGRLEGEVSLQVPGPALLEAWMALGGAEAVGWGETLLAARTLPALVGKTEGAQYLLLLGLVGEDLALFGLGLQPDLCRPGLGQAMLDKAAEVGRRTDRKGLIAPLSNADVLPFWFLQGLGFRLESVAPLEQKDAKGYGGLPRTHRFLLRRGL